jgi:hypothetical protein
VAETAGLLILEAAGVGGLPGIAGLGTIAGTTIGGLSIATVVGSAAILGATIGLQYALRPGLPKPEDGAQAVKQAIPPRIRGYGINRLAGYYMLFEAAGSPPATSYDVMAFHSGRIGAITQLYLNDDPITVTSLGSLNAGVAQTVAGTYGDGRYGGGRIQLQAALGASSQAASTLITGDPGVSALWTSAHHGNGIAWIAMTCGGAGTVDQQTKIFPHGLPLLSLVAQCSPVWDPRDPAQLLADPSTWRVSYNPVIQLIDYLTRTDGGMGLSYATIIAPNIAAWITEANYCDQAVATASGSEPRYQSSGWFQFDNKPEDVIGALLSTCDGWLAESGDGTLSIFVGVYRAPTDPPLTEKHIFGFALNYGQADEQVVNQLEISFTDPTNKYVEVQTDSWRDEESIALTGVVRSQPLDLKWVQSYSQARRLAGRAMQRLNPLMSGSFTTSLYGLRYLGKRWIPIQYPFVSGLQNAVVEIQNADVDIIGGLITWDFNLVETDQIEAYNPATDEGSIPIVPPGLPRPTAGLTFSLASNSQYLALLEDI